MAKNPSSGGWRSTKLTKREIEILTMLADEAASNVEIALRFKISEETVKRHFTNIMDKIGCHTRLELAVRYINHRFSQGKDPQMQELHTQLAARDVKIKEQSTRITILERSLQLVGGQVRPENG